MAPLPAFSQDEDGDVKAVAEPSPLAQEPTTQAEHMDAALLVLKLARTDLAKKYLSDLLKMNPTDEDLLTLRDEYGTAVFLQLSGVEGLQPDSTILLEKLKTAVKRKTTDPEYVSKIMPKLVGTSRERDEALNELRHLGSEAIPGLLLELQNPKGIPKDTVIVTMVQLGNDAEEPLIGALLSNDISIRTAAAEVLGNISSERNSLWLYRMAFDENQSPAARTTARNSMAKIIYGDHRFASRISGYGASRKLLKTAEEHLTETYEWPDHHQGQAEIPVWAWDEQLKTVTKSIVPPKQASIFFAERLARDAAALSPSDEQAPIVVLAARMARDVNLTGWDNAVPVAPGSAHELAVRSGPETALKTLQFGLDNDIPSVSLVSLNALARNGSAAQLSRKSIVVEALDAPHPRLQFAAALTILQWEPKKSFNGSSRVVEILGRALQSEGKAGGVVMDPNVERGSVTVGMFGELGFRSHLVSTGMSGFRTATEHGNIELAVLHPNVIRWELSQTLANLRADSRTRNLPVVIYGPAASADRYKKLTEEYKNVAYVSQAISAIDVNKSLRPVLLQLSPPPLTDQQRVDNQTEAAFWLQRIASHSSTDVFNLAPIEAVISKAINNQAVGEDAMSALVSIGRNSVQTRLLEIATSPTGTASFRELAALQLGYHIQKHGTLLSKAELNTLQSNWKSESEPNVKAAMSSAIGSMKPSASAARNEILSAPLPSAPNAP